jgi:hypothetical protein
LEAFQLDNAQTMSAPGYARDLLSVYDEPRVSGDGQNASIKM